MMNKVLADRAMRKLGQCSFEQLKVTEQELLDEIYAGGLTPELIQKVYTMNFVVILSAQNRSISPAEYGVLIGDLAKLFEIY